MSHIYSVFVIFLCLALGYITQHIVPIIPASLYGMFYFAIGLNTEVFKADQIKQTIEWIIKYTGVCFVPAGVGIMNYFDLLKANGLGLLLFTIVTTILLMVLVGKAYQFSLAKQEKAIQENTIQENTEQEKSVTRGSD
ncbi:CidA/LrgA family protein [Colwellia sp. MEBiC06753]